MFDTLGSDSSRNEGMVTSVGSAGEEQYNIIPALLMSYYLTMSQSDVVQSTGGEYGSCSVL
jgi:hypothetical protein